MRIAVMQFDPLMGDFEGNSRRILELATRAAQENCALAIGPELCLCGYPPRDLVERPRFVAAQWAALESLAKALPLPTILGAIKELGPQTLTAHLANTAVVCGQGKIAAIYHKRLLPTYDVFDEHRHFVPGSGPLVVNVAGKRIGLTVCEDIWQRPGSRLAHSVDPVQDLNGNIDLLCNLSASPYHYGKGRERLDLLSSVAKGLDCPLVYANQVGAQDELLFDGGSCAFDRQGRLIAHAKRWEDDLLIFDLDATPCTVPTENLEDLRQALVMGIRGYCQKTRHTRAVLGLSGGIDSAIVAVLATQALGSENVTGLLMPGPYSSPGSITDAQETARLLGMPWHMCPITEANSTMLKVLEKPFAGTKPNVAEENLQSRLRGALVMAYANRFGAIALTTGNKSELSVGYCTLYGDTNGGLAPIGDLYKTTIYALAQHLNVDRKRIPLDSIEKPPSAELAPGQRDSDSLPPYPVLDRILRAIIEGGRDPQDLTDEDPATLKRIWRLLEINEWKRRQCPPALRVSPKAFGMGRRIPLARWIGA